MTRSKIAGLALLAMGSLVSCALPLAAQENNTYVQHATRFAISPPLRDLAKMPQAPVYGLHLANPVRRETRNNFDARVDQKFSDKDNAFVRFSIENQPSFIPGTFGGLADGGGFFSGDENFSYRSVAASWTHFFRPELINEFRLGYNRVNAQRLELNANTNVSGSPSINFPGVPFSPGRFAVLSDDEC